ncbi:Glycerol-3-phosphate acyltransferase [Nymphon striatum]|nr:Glycerol-3-phosphate acyltransferase [Nymphon striatum]
MLILIPHNAHSLITMNFKYFMTIQYFSKLSVVLSASLLIIACTDTSSVSNGTTKEMTQDQAKSSKKVETPSSTIIDSTSSFTKTDVKVGDGAEAQTGQTVAVHYTGWLYDVGAPDNHGTKFDSSRDRGQPFAFPLGAGRVIKGWDQGVVGMKVGGQRTLIIPPEMGYGSRGAGRAIPPNATLIFDVELINHHNLVLGIPYIPLHLDNPLKPGYNSNLNAQECYADLLKTYAITPNKKYNSFQFQFYGEDPLQHKSIGYKCCLQTHGNLLAVIRSSAFINETDDGIIDKLQSVLSRKLAESRTATLGPDISHRRTLVRDLILKPDVQAAIKKRSVEDSLTEYKATLQAQRYLNEIVANCTNITIQVMQRGLTSFWNRFYSGIEVSNNDYLKNLAQSHELVYVPCHRSHIDYLLLSYVIYHEGLAIPYIAAGKNLNMPIIGSILRGGGAFFIRRSFKGNELYSTVMNEYVAELVSKGVSIEYFVEGGRSRTGRLLKPKPGMLAMTIRGFLKYRKKPIAFIPVYIGYEKLLESKAYQAELSGEDKKSETFFNSIRSILRIRGNFGKVYTNFGKPVFLNKILDYQQPSWLSEDYNDAMRPKWLREVVKSTSFDIMKKINQAATVNSINLLSTVLLATPKQSMDQGELELMLEMYQSIISFQNYSERLIITSRTGKEQIEHAETLKMVNRRRHELGDIIYLDEKHSISLTYYRNNTLHLLALPSIIACCFFNKKAQEEQDIIQLISLAYPFIQNELFLTWDKDDLPKVIIHTLDVMCQQKLLIKKTDSNSYSRYGSGTLQFTRLNQLARVISPILEVYYLTLALLSQSGTETIPKDELAKEMPTYG